MTPGSLLAPFTERSTKMIQHSLHSPTHNAPTPTNKRFWQRRGTKIGGLFLGSALLFVLSYVLAAMIAIGPITAFRMATNGDSNFHTFKIFPQRPIARGGPVSDLKQGS